VMAIGMLAVAGVGAAFVSEWFVAALEPAMDAAGINEVFAGLVIVAIAGNAVENFVGIQLAAKNQMDYAVQVILQSPVQIALTIAPIICLAAVWLGQPGFDLVFSPLLLAVMIMSALVAVLVTFDGESNWFEGAVLCALYVAIATSFWWWEVRSPRSSRRTGPRRRRVFSRRSSTSASPAPTASRSWC